MADVSRISRETKTTTYSGCKRQSSILEKANQKNAGRRIEELGRGGKKGGIKIPGNSAPKGGDVRGGGAGLFKLEYPKQ